MRSVPVDIPQALDRLDRVLLVPGVDYTSHRWHDESFGAVNLLNGICGNREQPALHENLVVFLDGEIANLRELWIESKGSLDELPSPARACLELYRLHGDDFVSSLNGQFNILVYDGSGVRVYNDRLAYRPFHYWCEEGLAAFALEKKAVISAAGRNPSFDARGVLEFLIFGHCLDDRTVFAGLKVMPQASMLDIRDGEARVRPYARLSYAKRPVTGSVEHASRELGERLRRATERRAPSGRAYGILLSGGLDSRAVAGSLARTGLPVTSFTFGSDESPDLRYGRDIARELSFAHQRLRYEEVSFAELLPQVVWRTEGSVPFNVPLSIAHHRVIRQSADVVFNGHFGDALTGGHLLPGQFLAGNMARLARHILSKRSLLRLSDLGEFCRHSFLRDTYPDVAGGLEQCLASLDEARAPLAYNLWDMTVRQPRYTFSSPAVDRYVVEQVTPFTDNDVVQWMLSLPLRLLLGQPAYKRMIVRGFPEIAGVPWARTGNPVPTNSVLDLAVQARMFLAKRVGRLVRTSRPSMKDPRVLGLQDRFEALADGVLPGEFFDREGVRSAVTSAARGSGSSTALFLLLTLAECSRLFGSGELGDPPAETWPHL